MSQMSDYLEDAVRTLVFRSGAGFAKPTHLYIALYTVAPTDAGGGTEVSTSGSAYARAQYDPADGTLNSVAGWTNSTLNTTTNATAISWSTATSAWGDVVAWGIFDASTSGNLLIYGTCATQTLVIGSNFSFAAGQIVITFGGGMSDWLKDQLRTLMFRASTGFAKTSHLYVAFFTVTPTSAGGGTEVTGNNYSRTDNAPGDSRWSAGTSTNGQTGNASTITSPTASGTWGQVVAFALFDASTSGNMVCFGALATSPTVVANGYLEFLTNQLLIACA